MEESLIQGVNQQGTLNAYIAGLMDGEGTFEIYKCIFKKREHRNVNIMLANTDRKIIQIFIDFLKQNGIHYHIYTYDRKKSGRKIQYHISLVSHSSKIKFIDLIISYLQKNKEFAELIREFSKYRYEKWLTWRKNGGNFKNRGNYFNQEEEEDDKFYQKYRMLRDASETISQTSYNFEKDEDIVQPLLKNKE